MTAPRDVLNRLRWDASSPTLQGVRIHYRHRGAPGDAAVLRGEDVVAVGRSFLDLPDGGRLPQHRILRIDRDGGVVWQRGRDTRAP